MTFLPTSSSFKASVEKSKWYERMCEFEWWFHVDLNHFNKVPAYEAIDSYFVWGNGDIAAECYGKVCEVRVPD